MIVTARADGVLEFGSLRVRCALGRGGVVEAGVKREGDGATPAGVWPLRRVLHRADRIRPPTTGLPVAAIGPDDGWCDAPDDPAYNRPVAHPYPASAERLWRDDGVYDLIVVLGHNDDPVRPDLGSAVFLHVARPDFAPTEGCVAVSLEDLLMLVSEVGPGDALEVRAHLQA